MRKQSLFWSMFVIALLAGAMLGTPLRYPVTALFRSEHFYHGMPSSYWSQSIRAWYRTLGVEERRPVPVLGAAMDYVGMGDGDPAVLYGGESALPVLCDLLKDENEFVRWRAAMSICQLGPMAKLALPDLIQALGGMDSAVRSWAAEALVRMGDEPAVLPALMQLLKHDDVGVRIDTARTIWRLTNRADIAVPALIDVLHRPHGERRWAALAVLAEIGPPAETALPEIEKATGDELVMVRIVAANALWKVTQQASVAVRVLADALKDDTWSLRCDAARVLGQMGPAAHAAAGALSKALDDTDPFVRLYAAEALWKIEQQADQVLPVLLAFLKSEKYWHRQRAAELLGRMGKAAAPATPALLAAMGDPQEEVRKAASVALQSISAEDALEH